MTCNVIYIHLKARYFCRINKNKEMINIKLLLLENSTHDNTKQGVARLAAIKSIQDIISQVDFATEEIPIDEPKKKIEVLTALKGKKLSKPELGIVFELGND